MPFGYWGRIIWIDLSTRRVDTEEPPEEIYRRFFGGYGLGIYYLYQRMHPGTEPLGKDNILGFLPGLLTGSGAGFSGRFMVVGRSPLTGAWGGQLWWRFWGRSARSGFGWLVYNREI